MGTEVEAVEELHIMSGSKYMKMRIRGMKLKTIWRIDNSRSEIRRDDENIAMAE